MLGRRWIGASSLIALLVAAVTAYGQVAANVGEIWGIVTDPEGKPLPGVTVTVESVLIGKRTAVTDVDGRYRFPNLPPGRDYRVRFTLQGFQPVVREEVEVRVGVSTQVNAQMAPGAVGEVVVRGAAPVVDVKSTRVSTNLTRDVLQNVPSARDPWVMMEMAPGIIVDRANIGGSESGQQSDFTARGAPVEANQWTMDGITITDPAALGATPTYFDFDMFEELQITTGGADVEVFTGGVNLNIVTKRGGNRFSGGGRFYWTAQGLQASNVEDLLAQGRLISPATRGTRVGNTFDWGGNLGGPLVRDNLWFWAAYGRQDIDQLIPVAGDVDQHDRTILLNYNVKVNAQYGRHNAEFQFFLGDKKKFGRGAAADRPPETTYDQKGPSPFFKFMDDFFATDNLFLQIKFDYNLLYFQLIPKGGTNKPVIYDCRTGFCIWRNTYYWYDTERPTFDAALSATYYKSEFLGGNHEVKLGVTFRRARIESQSGFGNGFAYMYYDPTWEAGMGEAWFIRPNNNHDTVRRISLYAQDTYSLGRLTLVLGLRFDSQKNGLLEAFAPAHPMIPDILPAGRSEKASVPFTWNTLSPRLGFTLDVFGNSKTILKGAFALYPQQLGVDQVYALQPTQWREVDYAWLEDLNGNGVPDLNEIDFSEPLYVDHELGNPNKVNVAIDTDRFRPNKTLEVSLGVEQQVMQDLGVAVEAYYRRYFDFSRKYPWDPDSPPQPDPIYTQCWIPIGTIPPEFGGWTYYACNVPHPGGGLWTSWDDYWREAWGAELRFTKRMSHRWMLFGSATWNSTKEHFDSPDAYLALGTFTLAPDITPTNIPQTNDTEYATIGWKYSMADVWGNSRWQVKMGAVFQLPWGFNLGGTFLAREGFMIRSRYQVLLPRPYRGYGWGSRVDVLTDRRGERRYPTFWVVNARLEKVVDLARGRLFISIDGFNLTNNNMETRVNGRADQPTYLKILDLTAPRVFRLGLRYEF